MGIHFRVSEIVGVGLLSTAASAWVSDWLGGASIVVFWLGIKLLLTDDRIPVLLAAFAHQWMQVTIGIFYSAATGHILPAQSGSDYRPMVLIGLGCILSLAAGLRFGIYLVRDGRENREERPVAILTMTTLVAAYLVSVVSEGTIIAMINDYPTLRQILITVTVVRLGLLFLVMRRFCQPVFRPHLLGAILLGEIVLGFTGYFAGFREPLVLATIVLFEVFDYQKKVHWLALATLVFLGGLLAVTWVGVRGAYRQEVDSLDVSVNSKSARVGRINALASELFADNTGQFRNAADTLVDRMWAIYYPALAVARVPSVLSHTDGSILMAAVVHVLTPRVFFPGKADLLSDSEMVRKYSAARVAGAETNTSIAFGYAAESYIDFGLPWMFAPIFGFGVLMGAMYAWFLRTMWHRELGVAVVIVVFWISLYLFEKSWANMLGISASLIIYLGLPITLLDRLLAIRQVKRDAREEADHDFRMRFDARHG
jgi:hypothetical protein